MANQQVGHDMAVATFRSVTSSPSLLSVSAEEEAVLEKTPPSTSSKDSPGKTTQRQTESLMNRILEHTFRHIMKIVPSQYNLDKQTIKQFEVLYEWVQRNASMNHTQLGFVRCLEPLHLEPRKSCKNGWCSFTASPGSCPLKFDVYENFQPTLYRSHPFSFLLMESDWPLQDLISNYIHNLQACLSFYRREFSNWMVIPPSPVSASTARNISTTNKWRPDAGPRVMKVVSDDDKKSESTIKLEIKYRDDLCLVEGFSANGMRVLYVECRIDQDICTRHGWSLYWWPNGQIRSCLRYGSGVAQGVMIQWDQEGWFTNFGYAVSDEREILTTYLNFLSAPTLSEETKMYTKTATPTKDGGKMIQQCDAARLPFLEVEYRADGRIRRIQRWKHTTKESATQTMYFYRNQRIESIQSYLETDATQFKHGFWQGWSPDGERTFEQSYLRDVPLASYE